MENKEIIILALIFTGTFLIRIIYWKDFDGGFLFGLINMISAGLIMNNISNKKSKFQELKE